MDKSVLNKITDSIWEIPKSYRSDMRVPARVYISEEMLDAVLQDESLDQLVNVATLPGIEKYALAMPDVHEGYGFPVGGTAAFNLDEGIISPGGIGYDINCGIRLLKSTITFSEIESKAEELGYAMHREIPSGVGKGGALRLTTSELDNLLNEGVERLVKMGYGNMENLNFIESNGCLCEADASVVSEHAKKRGLDQIGTLGAGNHFVEVQVVDEIYDEQVAEEFGLFKDQVVVMVHTGSRGLGHQVATDYIRKMVSAMSEYGISVPDRELACAPFNSSEGKEYFAAMSAAANFAWCNREMITWELRNAWVDTLGRSGGELSLLYDVAHNIAKVEEHNINGVNKKVVVHRKGATRSFPGQPVLIPGSMGTASHVLVGLEESMNQSFGTVCHGAGRMMSRTKARNAISGYTLKDDLERKGILIMTSSMSGLAEEAPMAYKDVDNVVNVVHSAGLAKKVVRLIPKIVVKG